MHCPSTDCSDLSDNYFQEHTTSDIKNKKFNCKVCGINFKRRSSLRVHALKHRFRDISPACILQFFARVGTLC
ncbi:hypothetical protein X975_20543, partial [Stegodyphus mimosarum]